MKKLSGKLLLIIISFSLLVGVFIVGHLNKTENQTEGNNETNNLQIINDKDIPELKGGPEDLIRHPEQKLPNSQVFYNSNNRTLKEVALTFDDGPDNYYTPKILDILKQYNIKATFFIIGTRAQVHPEIVKRIVQEGHSIGNHTWDHPLLTRVSDDRLTEEVNKNEQELFSITGIKTALFRPPYGALTSEQASKISTMGYSIIDWSVDTRDWDRTPVPQIMKLVSKEVFPGGIILQHCAGGRGEDLSNTIKALPQIIELLKSKGYNFVPVQDLLGINAAI